MNSRGRSRSELEGESTWQFDTAPVKGKGKLHTAQDYTVSTGYGAFSRVETITYPSGPWVKQLYDVEWCINNRKLIPQGRMAAGKNF